MKLINFLFTSLISLYLFGGFELSTMVIATREPRAINDLSINELIKSYDCITVKKIISKIINKEIKEATGYAILIFSNDRIVASLEQQFYLPILKQWKRAHELKKDDIFLTIDGKYIPLKDIYFSNATIALCEIEVQDTHTFFVGNEGILVHNAAAFGAVLVAEAAPIIIEAATAISTSLITFYGSRILKKAVDPKIKKPNIESGKQDAQAPGMPTENDGYVPPKNWNGEKVKAPNGRGYGWPDKHGNIWVPSGPKGHGGPHWDVQRPNGTYENVLPGGQIRGKKNKKR